MAARRLIALLLVLLFLSSLAAALAPVQNGTKVVSTSSTSTTSTAEAPRLPDPDAESEARLVSQSIDASALRSIPIRVRVGDQLQLKVTSSKAGTIELAGLGPTEDVGAEQPAFFDVLLRDNGTFPVRFLGTDDEIATIEVSPPRPATAIR